MRFGQIETEKKVSQVVDFGRGNLVRAGKGEFEGSFLQYRRNVADGIERCAVVYKGNLAAQLFVRDTLGF